MGYIENMQEYEQDVKRFLNMLKTNIESIKRFNEINGFKYKINNTYKTLKHIIDYDFDGQENIDCLFAIKDGQYWSANYYNFIDILDDVTISFNREQIVIKEDFSEIYYFECGSSLDYQKITNDINSYFKNNNIDIFLTEEEISDKILEHQHNLPEKGYEIYDKISNEIFFSQYYRKCFYNVCKYYFTQDNKTRLFKLEQNDHNISYEDEIYFNTNTKILQLVNHFNNKLLKKN